MRGQVKIYQKKLKARRRRRALFYTLYSVAAAGLIFCGLSYVSQLDSLAVNKIVITGNSRIASSTIESIATHDLVGNYFYFFSKSNFLIYPYGTIRRDIYALPIVKSVDISLDGFHVMNISIVERSKVSLWCFGQFKDFSKCYSLDENGFIFAGDFCTKSSCPAVSQTASSSPLFIYRGIVTTTDPIGQNLLSPKEFKKVRFFIDQLTILGLEPRESMFQGDGYMTVLLAKGGNLIVNITDDLSTVLGNIQAIISNHAVVPSLSDFLSNLDYVKLDVGNKVVYKLKVQ